MLFEVFVFTCCFIISFITSIISNSNIYFIVLAMSFGGVEICMMKDIEYSRIMLVFVEL